VRARKQKQIKLARVRTVFVNCQKFVSLFVNPWPQWQPFEILSYMEFFLFIFVNILALDHFVIQEWMPKLLMASTIYAMKNLTLHKVQLQIRSG
jgi:hypothetical protein